MKEKDTTKYKKNSKKVRGSKLRKRTREYYRAKINDGLTTDELKDKFGEGSVKQYRQDMKKKSKAFLEETIFTLEYMDDKDFYKLFFDTTPNKKCHIGNASFQTFGQALICKFIDRVICDIQDDKNWMPKYYSIIGAINKVFKERYHNAFKVDTVIDHMAAVEGFRFEPWGDKERMERRGKKQSKK